MLASMAPTGSVNSQEGERTQGQGRGIWHPINPATARRTLKPTFGFLSETRVVSEPSSSIPCHAHGNSPSLQLHASPGAGRDTSKAQLSLSATCLLSLFIEYHCPSTGLCSQAPGFQSAFWEADRGQACRGRPPCLTPTNSLPRA